MLLLDSNIFIHCDFAEVIQNASSGAGLTSGVLAELDAMKDGEHKRPIRKAMKFILENRIPVLNDNSKLSVDDALIAKASQDGYVVCSNDIAVQIKCVSANVKWISAPVKEDYYSGMTRVILNKDNINIYQDILDGSNDNPLDLFANEYIIFYDEYNAFVDVFKWDGKEYFRLEEHNGVKPWNVEQRCAIDALLSDTPIKILVGCFGSAKTYLTTTIGYDKVMRKGDYGKMVLVRNNDTGASADEQIGFLPGTEHEKTRNLFTPIAQYFPQGVNELDKLLLGGVVETYITANIKGITLSDAFIIVDECEDLTLTQMKRIGSRIGEKSTLVFCGDSNQTEGHFKQSSGLESVIDHLKGSALVSIVRLNKDVRSEASKLFAEL